MTEPVIRKCNRHSDCDKADREAKDARARWIAAGRPTNPYRPFWEPQGYASHCDDEGCEECFGY